MSETKSGGDKRAQEAVAHIAKATGVESAHVAKILKHLGLDAALAHNPKAPASGIRIAANQVSM